MCLAYTAWTVNPSQFCIENSSTDNRYRVGFLILFSDFVQNLKQYGCSMNI